MMFEEFWASRCAPSGCRRNFGRHGALPQVFGEMLVVTVRSLMMFKEFWASRCTVSHDVENALGVTVRSLRISEEFWASRRAPSRFLRNFGRHGALSHDV